MGIPLILDKKIQPNEKVSFIVELSLGETTVQSPIISFTAPSAIDSMKLIESENFTATIKQEAGSSQTRNKSWQFNRYKKIAIKEGNNNVPGIIVRLVKAEDYKGLKKGEGAKFITSGDLSTLNNVSRNIKEREKDSKDFIYISFKITAVQWNAIPGPKWNAKKPPATSWVNVTAAQNSLRVELKTNQKNNVIELNMNSTLVENLINQTTVRDIIVYTFSQFNPSSSSVPDRYYIERNSNGTVKKNNDLKVGSRPLGYKRANDLFINAGKQKFKYSSLKFDPKDGSRLVFFATVVRYLRNSNGTWFPASQKDITDDSEIPEGSKEPPPGWLQLNESNKPVWARAVAIK